MAAVEIIICQTKQQKFVLQIHRVDDTVLVLEDFSGKNKTQVEFLQPKGTMNKWSLVQRKNHHPLLSVCLTGNDTSTRPYMIWCVE